MVFGIFGESCTGKSTLAQRLHEELGGTIYTGKDYLRLHKQESMAREAFRTLLRETDAPVIYVMTERELLSLLPEHALRVLVTAELAEIKARFAARMGGTLPPPVATMLEKKHGMFDGENATITGIAARRVWRLPARQFCARPYNSRTALVI